MKLNEKELRRRRNMDWTELYMQDMSKTSVPIDWAEAARYHVVNAWHFSVRNFKALSWKPIHVDREARLIDEADVWCSLEIEGKPHVATVKMRGEVSVEMEEAQGKEPLPYWNN